MMIAVQAAAKAEIPIAIFAETQVDLGSRKFFVI
jgi:hypothetical protein